MSGLGRLVAGVGTFAGGFAEGQRQRSLMDARTFELDRAKKKAKQEDDQTALDEEARQAGAAYLDQRRQAAAGQQPAVPGTEPPAGQDGVADGAVMPQQAPLAQWSPNAEERAGAMQAHIDKLFAQGRTEHGLRGMVQMEQMFGPMRQKAVNEGLAAFKLNGDPSTLIKAYNDYLPDGRKITLVNTTQTEDGRPLYVTKVRSDATGKETPLVMDAEQVEAYAAQIIDPKSALLHSYQARMQEIKGKQAADRETSRANTTLAAANIRAEASKENTQTRVQGTISAAQIRKAAGGGSGGNGGNLAKTVTNNDGTRTLIFRDGSSKTLVDEKTGKPLIGIEAEKVLQSLSGQIGKTIQGSLATPEANRARAADMLPKPRRSLSDFDVSAPPAQRPSLDSFQR